MPMNNKKITIGDIAEELQCSKTTVSRAISGKGRIGADTRDRILRYINENNYKPNIIAKSLAQSKTFNVGVILPDDPDLNEIPFFQSCLLGACEIASDMEYDVIVTTVGADDISKLIRMIENNKVDGIILTRSLLYDASVKYLKSCKIPFIVVGTSDDPDVVQIDNHHVEACKEMTSLLIVQGMKRLAFIGGNINHTVSRKRYKGFVEGCGKHLIPVNPDLVFHNANNKIQVDQIVTQILNHRVDCIVCMDDKICSQVLLKLKEDSVNVPEKIRVASFYDSFYLENNNPSVTALKMDEKQLGKTACQLLLRKLDGEETARKTLLGYEIVIRNSTKM